MADECPSPTFRTPADRENDPLAAVPDGLVKATIEKTVRSGFPPRVSGESTVSPGGKEENTGSASKFSDRLTMGSVEVTSRRSA